MRKTPINHIPIVKLDGMYLYDINTSFLQQYTKRKPNYAKPLKTL